MLYNTYAEGFAEAATIHIFELCDVILRVERGRSLGRYDDGLQNVANGFTDLKRDEEVLERLEKPVGTAPKTLSRGKVVGSNPAGPTNSYIFAGVFSVQNIQKSLCLVNFCGAR